MNRESMGERAEMVGPTAPELRSPAAERMRLHRERRRQGLRCLMIEISETEIEAFVHMGLLKTELRDDGEAVSAALYEHLNRTLRATP